MGAGRGEGPEGWSKKEKGLRDVGHSVVIVGVGVQGDYMVMEKYDRDYILKIYTHTHTYSFQT